MQSEHSWLCVNHFNFLCPVILSGKSRFINGLVIEGPTKSRHNYCRTELQLCRFDYHCSLFCHPMKVAPVLSFSIILLIFWETADYWCICTALPVCVQTYLCLCVPSMPVVSALTSLISLFHSLCRSHGLYSSLQQCHSREEIICVTNALGFKIGRRFLMSSLTFDCEKHKLWRLCKKLQMN